MEEPFSSSSVERTYQHYVRCVDLLYVSSLGAFVHSLLSHAYRSFS